MFSDPRIWVAWVVLGVLMVFVVDFLARKRLPVKYPDEAQLWSTKVLRRWSGLGPEGRLVVGIVLALFWPLTFAVVAGLIMTEAAP